MAEKYLSIPSSIADQDLLQGYLIAQWFCYHMPDTKVYICPESISVALGIVEYRAKKIIKLLDENFSFMCTYKNGLIVCREDFKLDEQFWTIGDDEFNSLITEPSLLFHYVTILKSMDENNMSTYSLDMFADIEHKGVTSLSKYNTELVQRGLITITSRMDKSNVYSLGHKYCAEAVDKYKEEVRYKIMGVQGGVDSISYKNGSLNRFIRKEIHNKVKGTIKKEYRLMNMEDLPDALVAIDKYVPSVELEDKISMLNAGLLIDKIK